MNSRDRIMTALAGRQPDRVPIFLRDLTLGMEVAGFTTWEVCAGGPNGGYHAEKSAHAVIMSWRRFGQDCVVGSIHDLGLDADALGGKTAFPSQGIPTVVRHPLEQKNRLLRAKVPQMDKDGRLPGVLKAYELVKRRIGAKVAIAANLEGPVTRACLLRGTHNLARDFVKDPKFATDLIAFSTEIAISHLRHLSKVGVDFVFLASATDGPVFIRPEFYLTYTIPNLRRIVTASSELGLGVVFHPHGNFTLERYRPLVDAALETGIVGFQFAENCDLRVAKRLWGDRSAILGGIDIPHVLHPGPQERIREETRRCISHAAPGGGYVFMATCSIHRGDPLGHIEAMVQAAREFGDYESISAWSASV
ncbi:MAG: uroporphyrinogen decarboxylase family protein [bacterium]